MTTQENSTPASPIPHLGLYTGIGLVIANMVGTGVFISAGYLVQDMSATAILWAWALGMSLALCGALAYGGLSHAVGKSGGEYRFLADILHPVLGCMAGWGSLFLGFSAPIAINAIALGAFAATIQTAISPEIIAGFSLILLIALHAFQLSASRNGQNLLVALKILLVTAFALVALIAGSWSWPDWVPPEAADGDSMAAFISSQYWIAFAFSGWNAAIYCMEEFKDPKKQVAKAMFVGCFAVGLLYLLVNWVFVANLTPEDGAVVFAYEEQRITLAHVVMKNLLGSGAGVVVSEASKVSKM